MRIGSIDGRLALIEDEGFVDVSKASDGRFTPDPQLIYERWDEFRAWAERFTGGMDAPLTLERLQAPVPRPRQVFALALNYAAHAAEASRDIPSVPLTFTKFQSCLTGPFDDIVLPSQTVDWEVELVVVIGRLAKNVTPEQAWSHVAGLMVGQDISERTIQHQGRPPQFSLGKSFPGFGPTGPWVCTPDSLPDPDDLAISCVVDGELLQESRTSKMIFPVAELVSRLSQICTLLPGDLIFTGTPEGVGAHRKPPRFLSVGSVVESRVDGIGEIRNRLVSAVEPAVGLARAAR